MWTSIIYNLLDATRLFSDGNEKKDNFGIDMSPGLNTHVYYLVWPKIEYPLAHDESVIILSCLVASKSALPQDYLNLAISHIIVVQIRHTLARRHTLTH